MMTDKDAGVKMENDVDNDITDDENKRKQEIITPEAGF